MESRAYKFAAGLPLSEIGEPRNPMSMLRACSHMVVSISCVCSSTCIQQAQNMKITLFKKEFLILKVMQE